MMATYNRALLREQTGDLRGAITDISRVLEAYPRFEAGYFRRAAIRRRVGDQKGADEDEFKVMKMQLDRRNGVDKANPQGDQNQEEEEANDESKTRKKSNRNMNNYRKIVVADDTEMSQKYTSDYRGRVQDRNVLVKLEPFFALTYYEKMSEVKKSVHTHRMIDELNQTKLFPRLLKITNMEAPLTAEQVNFHFALIDKHTSDIVANEQHAIKRFIRGLDFYLVQDFANAVDDYTQAILLDEHFFPAYFMRALVRCKQLEYRKAEGDSQEVKAVDYEIVKKDLDQVLQLAPDFVYAYFNRGNVMASLKDYRGALADYDKAIELSPAFAEAYYNRGLTHIYLGNNKQGIKDLSKAGELGIVAAYNVIKRFTFVRE